MKKITSLFLSLVMLLSVTAGLSFETQAAGMDLKPLTFGQKYTESASKDDYSDEVDGQTIYYDFYLFDVPENGKLTINLKSSNKEYLNTDDNLAVAIFKLEGEDVDWTYEGKSPISKASASFKKGKYVLAFAYSKIMEGNFKFTLDYKPSFGNAKLTKLSAKKKAFAATWKKSKKASGYQLQYSTSSKFTKKTTVTKNIKDPSKTSMTIKKLKGKKKYYVRIRSYKTVKIDGKKKTFYGKWSKNTVKTK